MAGRAAAVQRPGLSARAGRVGAQSGRRLSPCAQLRPDAADSSAHVTPRRRPSLAGHRRARHRARGGARAVRGLERGGAADRALLARRVRGPRGRHRLRRPHRRGRAPRRRPHRAARHGVLDDDRAARRPRARDARRAGRAQRRRSRSPAALAARRRGACSRSARCPALRRPRRMGPLLVAPGRARRRHPRARRLGLLVPSLVPAVPAAGSPAAFALLAVGVGLFALLATAPCARRAHPPRGRPARRSSAARGSARARAR